MIKHEGAGNTSYLDAANLIRKAAAESDYANLAKQVDRIYVEIGARVIHGVAQGGGEGEPRFDIPPEDTRKSSYPDYPA